MQNQALEWDMVAKRVWEGFRATELKVSACFIAQKAIGKVDS